MRGLFTKKIFFKKTKGFFLILIFLMSSHYNGNYIYPNEALASSEPIVGFFSPDNTTQSFGNQGSYGITQPDPRSGDLMIAIMVTRPSTVVMATPAGWTSLSSRVGTDGGAEGAGTGSVRTQTFYKVATGTEGTGVIFTKSAGSGSATIGKIVKFRSSTATYDISSSGYSVNGDSTNWSGALGADIGLTAGDAVLMINAQNGNVATNVTDHEITATGITSKSTVTEHNEYSTTAGNDLRIVISDTLIWEGTNTDIPVVSSTMSAAVSGSITAIRVRQGAGTNRNDTWVRSAGAPAAGGTSANVPYPSHGINDMFVLFITSRSLTAPNFPAGGWTALGTYSGTLGSTTVDSGPSSIRAFYKKATSLNTGTQAISGGSTTAVLGQMVSVHKDDLNEWILSADGGNDQTSGTGWSVTGTGLDLDSAFGGDIVLIGTGVNTDAYTYTSHALSAAGITFGEVTETSELRSTVGNDATINIVTGRVSSGSDPAAITTFTKTASGSTANGPAGASIMVKIIGLTSTFEQSSYRFFQNNNSTDVGSALNSQNTPSTLSSPGASFRLRLLIHVDDAEVAIGEENFKLQFAEKSGSCDTSFSGETYSDVTGASLISFNDNASPSDSDALTPNVDDPTHGADVVVNQNYEELNNFTNSAVIPAGQDGKWDFSLIDNGAATNTSYCFRVVKSDDTELETYSTIPEITTSGGGALSVDIVDTGGTTVGSPSVPMSSVNFSFSDQTASGSFGTSTEKIRVDNGTGTATWTLSLAADDGPTAFWDSASADYDFNDPTASAGDGGDADSLGGQMTLDPSSATITPEGGCTLTNISSGALSSFSEGVTDSITLASAASGADTGCYWDITDIDISQTIPPEQAADSYSIDMTLSIIAS